MTTSQIDPAKPTAGNPTTASVRQNFLYARNEISALFAALDPTAGVFLLKSQALNDIADKLAARNHLGLGSASTFGAAFFQTADDAAVDAYNLSLITARVNALEATGGEGAGGGASDDLEYAQLLISDPTPDLSSNLAAALVRITALETFAATPPAAASNDDEEYLQALA